MIGALVYISRDDFSNAWALVIGNLGVAEV
jgi:hypothetical protein